MALSRAPALDVPILSAAFERLGGIAGFIESGAEARRSAGVPAAAGGYLESAAALPNAAERAWIENPHHHLVAFTDPRYPASLRLLANRPIALYVAGHPEVLNDPQLSIVGSRNPTAAGRDTAFDFAESLAARGLAITSGLAEGIDSAAHRGALAAQGVTLAVLGNGVDAIYPRCNRALGRGDCFSRRLDQRIPAGHAAATREFSAGGIGIIGVFGSRHAGGRGGAPLRLADHRARSPGSWVENCSPSPARFTTP